MLPLELLEPPPWCRRRWVRRAALLAPSLDTSAAPPAEAMEPVTPAVAGDIGATPRAPDAR
jgi:hypothetical protein